MMKNVKLLGNYGFFFMITGLAVAMSIVFFDYSIAAEINHYFHSPGSPYVIPLWISIGSAIGINLVGIMLAFLFMKGLKNIVRTNKQQAKHQKATQY